MLNLVSDSSCDLISGELNSPYARLTVAPMCLHVGGQDYLIRRSWIFRHC